jgi:hypothetical protein
LRECGLHRSGDTRYSAAAYRWRLMWLLCSFQGPSRGVYAGRRWVHAGALICASAPPPADAGLSKLNSMLALLWTRVESNSK